MNKKDDNSSAKTLTKSETIWNEIKAKTINVFAEDKTVSDFCKPANIDPENCYLMFSPSAVLPALESAVGKDYSCTLVERYILVQKRVSLPTPKV